MELNEADASTLLAEKKIDSKEAETGPTPGVSPSGWLALPPTPWRRYGARMLDTSLNGSIMFLLIAVAFYAIAPASADEFFLFFEADGARIVDAVLTAIFASFLNGSLIGVSGFTLGKWIFGVKVTRLDGTKLGIGAGLSRDFTVLLKGLGLGIPVVALFTLWFSYKALSKNKSTSWDQGNYIVWHRPSGTSQYVLNVVGILLTVIVLGGLNAMGGL
ncbi:MAG: RDD family protein [Rhodospirillales bacterium]|nr:RDD family protein [Rhodospirillales bacterium]